MIFLDANIFLYAAGAAHSYRAPCLAVLRSVAAKKITATTSVEVVQEVVYVLDRRGQRTKAVELGREILRLFPDVLPITGAEAALACEILERYPALSSRDSLHVATMLCNGLDEILSVDPDFDSVREVRRILPCPV